MKDSVLRLLKKSCIVKIIGLVFLFFGVNIYLSYATDSYYVLTTGFHGAAIDMVMRNGRPLIGLIYELHYLSGFSNISFYYISSALALIFLCASIWIYQEILKKYGIKENTRILLAFSAIVNIFIIEYFMFIEKCGFTLAVLFNVLAVYWMERVLSEQRKSCYVLAVITMTLAIFTYQGTVALFVILSIPFVMKNSKCFRHYISNGILLVGGYFIPAIIDLLAFKTVFKSTRIAEKTDYITSFKNVLSGIISNGKVTFNILPQYFYLIVFFIIFLCLIVDTMASQRYDRLERVFNIFIIIIAGCVFSTGIIVQGSGVWEPRAVYPIASIAPVLAISLFVNRDAIDPNGVIKRTVSGISISAILILLTFQYFSFNKIYINKYQLNACDQYRYQYIYQAICDYQDKTGIEIKKIAIYNDAASSWPQYSDLYCTGDLVVSAFSASWSDVTALNYYMQTSYEKISQVEEYTKFFSKKNWDHLSNDQLVFSGDTLHLCVY